jgi:hypothetical protein
MNWPRFTRARLFLGELRLCGPSYKPRRTLPNAAIRATFNPALSGPTIRGDGVIMFAALPLLALPVLFYNFVVLAMLPGRFGSVVANDRMTQQLFSVPMASGGHWSVSLGDMMVFASLVILFIELLKSTTSQRIAIINHSLSMILFIICLVEFLLSRAFSTSAFLLLTAMVLLDVLAGFIVTIVASRRAVEVMH